MTVTTPTPTAAESNGARDDGPPGRQEALWRRHDLWSLVALPGATALATSLAAVPWFRAYSIPGAAAVLVVAAILATLAPVAVARGLRQPPFVSYGVSLAALAVFVGVAVSHSPSALATGLAHGPSQLLTETLPLTGNRAQLIAPILIVWLTAAACSELLTRTARTGPAFAIVVLAYLAAYAATTGSPRRDDVTGPLLLGGLALLALVRRQIADRWSGTIDALPVPGERRRTGTRRRAALGALLAAGLAVGLGVGVPRLTAMRHRSAALSRQPPTSTSVIVDPVDAIESLRDDDPRAAPTILGRVTTSAPAPGYFGIAILDAYDGDTWSFDSTFSPTGGRVPPAPAGLPGAISAVDSATVRQDIDLVHSYGLPLIPVLSRPVDVRGLAVDDAPANGMVIPAGTLGIPSRYDVTSQVPTVTLASTPAGDAIDAYGGIAPPGESDLSLPAGTGSDIAAAVRYLGSITGLRPAPTVRFLQAAAAALHRRERRVNPVLDTNSAAPTVSRGGTSLAEVINAVVVSHKATPEQFATLFVVAARELGVPARLVTGFRTEPTPDGPPLPAGTYALTNRDGWTWAEIPVIGVGWVVADPTPARTASGTAAPPSAASSSPTTLPPRHAYAVPTNARGGGHSLARPTRLAVAHRHQVSPWADAGLAVLAALLLLLGLGPGQAAARRALRRRTRRSGAPDALAVGAWLELLDGLRIAGMPTPPDATSAELARAAQQHFGGDLDGPIGAVGAVADRAVFSSQSSPDAADAASSWATQQVVRRRVMATLDRRQRAAALLAVGNQPRRPLGDRDRHQGGPRRRRRGATGTRASGRQVR